MRSIAIGRRREHCRIIDNDGNIEEGKRIAFFEIGRWAKGKARTLLDEETNLRRLLIGTHSSLHYTSQLSTTSFKWLYLHAYDLKKKVVLNFFFLFARLSFCQRLWSRFNGCLTFPYDLKNNRRVPRMTPTGMTVVTDSTVTTEGGVCYLSDCSGWRVRWWWRLRRLKV